MYEIKQLEERWQRYKIKQYAPAGVLGVAFIFVVIGGIFLSSEDAKAHISLPSNTTMQSAKLESNPIIAQLETGSNHTLSVVKPTIENNVEDALFLDPSDATFPVAPVGTSYKEKQKVVIEIKKVPVDKSVLESVMERFKKDKDPYDSLFLASTYYSDGEYAKAHDWAVETNKIANINESWMVLAKAKYKLGKKEEALGLLKALLKTQDSKEAEDLIEKIQKDII
jgi:tetratricopeptide (TPR) repeat protein